MLIMTLKIIFVVVMVLGAYLFFSDIIHSMFRKKPTDVALLDDLEEKDGVPVVPRHLRKHIHQDENDEEKNNETEEVESENLSETDDVNNKEVKNLKTIAQKKQKKDEPVAEEPIIEETENTAVDSNDVDEEPELKSSLFATEFDEEVKKSLQKDMEVLNNIDNQLETDSSAIAEGATTEENPSEKVTETVSEKQATPASPYANPFQVGSSQSELHYSSSYTIQQNVTSTTKVEPHSPLLEQSLNDNHNPEQDSPLTNASDNLNIVILPSDDTRLISAEKLLKIIDDFGFKFGTMNMLHRYQNKDGSGILWFSMMGLTKEGVITFDLNTLPTIEDLKGLVMFLPLPHPNVLQGFDSMMSISGLISREIDGYIIDEYGDEMTTEYKKELRNLLQATLIDDE